MGRQGPRRLVKTSRKTAAERLEVTIENLAFGGQGVARDQGRVVFIPRTAPGDRVVARVVQTHRSYLEAELTELVTPGPGRRSPPCAYWDECGGCQLMHLEYRSQLEAKREFVTHAFRRIGRLAVEVDPVRPAPCEAGYRHRATLRGAFTGAQFTMGFLRLKTHELVDAPRCPVLHPRLTAFLEEFRALFVERISRLSDLRNASLFPSPGSSREDQAEFKLEAQIDGRDRVGLIVFGSPASLPLFRDIVADRARTRVVACRVIGPSGERLWESPPSSPLGYDLELAGGPALEYRFSLGAFTQINLTQNERLVNEVLHLAEVSKTDRVLDLYSGIGNYSIPLARVAQEVLGVECSPTAVQDARENARLHGLANVRFEQKPAATVLRDLAEQKTPFDLVVLNPTRAGALETVPHLARMAPARILHVSCSPPTLARDVAALAGLGYRVRRVIPFDLFPQTYHVETVALLTKSAGPSREEA